MAKEWAAIQCAYCGSTIPFVKLADVMQVKCRKCSRLQTVSIPKVVEEPKEEDQTAYEVPIKSKKKKKKKFVDSEITDIRTHILIDDSIDVTDTYKNIDYRLEE